MGDLKFGDNYNDLCEKSGVNAGFQFEFFCERCNDTWRSEFVPFRSGQASGWIGRASGLLGGVLGGAGEALEGLAESRWGQVRDEAFQTAIRGAQGHFHRCARCSQYVCDRCWNQDRGLCLNCGPSAEVEIEAARSEGEVSAAAEEARAEGMRRGKEMDVKRDRQLSCPQCGAETGGAKFCPECGAKLAVVVRCPACSQEVSPGVKFCPECGQKMGG
jgi:hypothetical protein